MLLGAADEVRVKVPGAEHNSYGRIGNKDDNLFVIRFRLPERVVQNDVNGVLDRLVRINLDDHYTVTVLVDVLATPISTTS